MLSTATIADSVEMVLVSKAELERLRKLEEELPAILEKVNQERDKERLKELTQHHKDNPEEHRQKVKEYYSKNKETILAKRRDAYNKKKMMLPS